MMVEKHYVAEIPVKGHTLTFKKKCLVEEGTPHYTQEICTAIGKGIEKILNDNQLDVSQIESVKHESSSCEHADGNVLEVKIFAIEIKTKEGKTYSLQEYTYPEVFL